MSSIMYTVLSFHLHTTCLLFDSWGHNSNPSSVSIGAILQSVRSRREGEDKTLFGGVRARARDPGSLAVWEENLLSDLGFLFRK